MKSWRGVPVLVSMFSGLVVGCGPELEVGGAEAALESEGAVAGVTAVEGAARREEASLALLSSGWEVCSDEARRVRDIYPGDVGSDPQWLAPSGLGMLLFSATDREGGRELWVSGGKERSTSRVKDLIPGPTGSAPASLTPLGRWVLFAAADAAHGPELWRTDGTAEGTELVKDVVAGTDGASPEKLTAVGDLVYFLVSEGGRQVLWRTDGTARGTERVRGFERAGASLTFEALVAWGDTLAVATFDNAEGGALWTVDGKGRVRRLASPGFLNILRLTAVGRRLFFLVADLGTDESTLWVTRDAPGTARALRRFPGALPMDFTELGDSVYFVAGGEGFFGGPGDLAHGSELWSSDGTVAGTRLVRDIQPGSAGAFHHENTSGMVAVGGTLYFAADDGDLGTELWRSNGTAQGTWRVRDLAPGKASSYPQKLAGDSGTLFFSADTPGHGREAWYSQGREWNTRPLADIAPGAESSGPEGFVRAGLNVYFRASDGETGVELWTVPFRPLWFCGWD